MDKYNQFELEVIRDSIREALKEELNKEERYCFLTNLSLVNSEINKLNEDLPEDVPEYQEYRNKVVRALIDNGAEHNQTDNGTVFITSTKNLDEEKYSKELKELNEEYKEVLEKQSKVLNEKQEKKNQRIAEINWVTLDFDHFETSSEKVMNENTLHLINRG